MPLRARNWNRFQHYKNRRPPWIRVYRALLDDPEFMNLSGDASKMLVMCWLMASENDGKLPSLQTISFRVRMEVSRVEKLLSQLNHWLISDASNVLAFRKQDATTETESESESLSLTETKTDSEAEGDSGASAPLPPSLRRGFRECPDDYLPSMKTMNDLLEKGFTATEVGEAVEAMKDWSRAGGKRKKDWDATLRNWMRHDKQNQRGNGKTRTRVAIEEFLADE